MRKNYLSISVVLDFFFMLYTKSFPRSEYTLNISIQTFKNKNIIFQYRIENNDKNIAQLTNYIENELNAEGEKIRSSYNIHQLRMTFIL